MQDSLLSRFDLLFIVLDQVSQTFEMLLQSMRDKTFAVSTHLVSDTLILLSPFIVWFQKK